MHPEDGSWKELAPDHDQWRAVVMQLARWIVGKQETEAQACSMVC
jgi:hypothetical protein